MSTACVPALQALEARRSERLWRERVNAFSSTLDQHKEDTLDITADMMRQYKGMQVRHIAGGCRDGAGPAVHGTEVVRALSAAVARSGDDTWTCLHPLLQEQLLKRVSDLEAENIKLQKGLEEKDAEIKRLQQEKDAQKKASDTEVGCPLASLRSQAAFTGSMHARASPPLGCSCLASGLTHGSHEW